MKAIIITKPGLPGVLELSEVDKPEPAKGEILIKVKAVGVNRADCIQRQGRYPAPADCPQDIPGLEYAGVVEKSGGSAFKKGDKVFGLVGGGSYAEYLVTHERTVARMPKKMSFVQAAAVPEAFVTAYDAIVEQGQLKSGQFVLVNAAGSGVGMAALQICKTLGAKCVGTVRSKSKADRLAELGFKNIIVCTDGKFSKDIVPLTHDNNVDLVVELVGGDYIEEDLNCLAPKGKIILIGLLAGNRTQVNLGALLSKRATIKGTTLRARPLEEKIAAAQLLTKNICPLFESGDLKPNIDRVFSLSEAAEAHKMMEKNENLGKIVLELE